MKSNKERIELGCHTKMSEVYGLDNVEDYIDEAINRGYKAIGITDINTVQNFIPAQEHLEKLDKEDFKILYGVRAKFIEDKYQNEKNKNDAYDIVIYVKEQKGLKNLYNILSLANTQNDDGIIYKSQLDKYRGGLLYGTVGNKGELYQNILFNKPETEEKAKYYDFLEIEPLYDYKSEYDKKEMQEINKEIIEIGNKQNILVVAASNCKFIDKEDKICNEILNHYKNVAPVETDNRRHMHTTEEMLQEFDYLGKETAYKIIVENTNLLADKCDKINTIIKGKHYPKIENSKRIIKEKTYKRAHEIYGEKLPENVENRLELELDTIIKNDFEIMYLLASEAVKKSNEEGYLVSTRGCVGDSFVAYLLGITEYNPIEYNLPFEVFAGKDYDREPDIDLNFAPEIRDEIINYIKGKFGDNKIICCGTVGTLAEKTVGNAIDKYLEDLELTIDDNEKEKIINKLVGIKRNNGIHPGGIIIIPEDNDITDFAPVEKDKYDGKIKTQIDYHSLDMNLYKFDIIQDKILTALHQLKEITGIDPKNIKLDDKETLELFSNAQNGIKWISLFSTETATKILKTIKPKNFNDLVCIDGLLHGTDVWSYNEEDVIKNGTAKVNDLVSNREDLMNYLVSKGIEKNLAYDITKFIRMGRPLKARYNKIFNPKFNEKMLEKWNEYKRIMENHDIPEWYIKSCSKITYLFSKPYSIESTLKNFRIAWYKVHYPEAFYKVYFDIFSNIDINKYRDIPQVKRRMIYLKSIEDKNIESELKCNYENELDDLEMLIEMFEKGIKKNDNQNKDVYDLVNSKAIGDYCREIGHKFNTEELAVLICRNKRMSVDEKIKEYNNLIKNYPDMEVIERINCDHYDSVKDMIKEEITRLETLRKKIVEDEQDVVYSYNYNCDHNGYFIEGKHNEFRDIYKTYNEVNKIINEEIENDEDKEIVSFIITKRTISKQDGYSIRAEYLLDENRKLKMVNICKVGEWPNISSICLNIPTPFKEGDILVANSKTPFSEEYVLDYDRFPFVLEYLMTWNDNFSTRLSEGNFDSSDMQGPGDYISEDGSICYDNIFDYDSWEYFDGELKGKDRILKAISSLKKGKIDINLFINAYEEIKKDNIITDVDYFTDEGLEFAGFSDEDIKNIRK